MKRSAPDVTGASTALKKPCAASRRRAADAALLTVLTSLIDLLVGFIGEELTLRLVAEIWPDLALPEPIQPGTFDGQEAAS